MISRKFEDVNSLIKYTDGRWKDMSYKASLRIKTIAMELFNLFLINSLKMTNVSYLYKFDSLAREKQVIIALWHGSLLGCLYAFRDRNIAVMTSLSRDGDLTTKVLDSLGYQALRGSSSRGGARVFLEAVKRIRNQVSVAFTVDGPKGPVHEVKPGIVKLAQKTKCPIIPLSAAYQSALTLKSWDRFQIPLPFSKVVVSAGTPFVIEPDLSVEEGCNAIKQALLENEKTALEKLKVG